MDKLAGFGCMEKPANGGSIPLRPTFLKMQKANKQTKLIIVKGSNRQSNIHKVLMFIKQDIKKAIKNKNSDILFIKINAIDINYLHACTHIYTISTVLNFFNKNFKNKFKKIIVGDNAFAFTKSGGGPYKRLLKEHKIILSDLGEFPSQEIEFKQLNHKLIKTKISKLPQIAFTVSLALPKTHDEFVYTGCLKNMFGCVLKKRVALHAISILERILIDKGVKANKLKKENLLRVFKKAPADLYILDGFTGMQGNGPVNGQQINLGICMCSMNGFIVDKLASRIIGLKKVPYLSDIDEKNFKIIKSGFNNLNQISKKFEPHYKIRYQLMQEWKGMPKIDFKFLCHVLKRSYRIKDKFIEKIRGKIKS